MPRRTLLFLAAIALALGAIILQFTWMYSQLDRDYTGKYRHVNIRALTNFIIPDSRPALPYVPEWAVLRQRDLSIRAHRICHNLCLTCGYDLRAAPARCPECGTPVPDPSVVPVPQHR